MPRFLNAAIVPHHGLDGFHILCVSDPMFLHVINGIMYYIFLCRHNEHTGS